MEAFNIKDLSFTYPNGKRAVNGINLTIPKGELVCLCGPSGCGKTTLLKLLKPALSPAGEILGEIDFCGVPVNSLTEREQALRIGYVLQDVESQIVTDKVWHELAFGLESLGIKGDEIRKRVAEMAAFFGIDEWFHKKTSELSGGQKQLLNLASVLVMQPDVLILDEPTSQLDPIASEEFLKTLVKINKEFAKTIILSEHRLEEIFPIADKIVVMDSGNVVCCDEPKAVAKKLKEQKHTMYMSLPTPVRVYSALEDKNDFPLTVRDGRSWLENYAKTYQYDEKHIPCDDVRRGDDYIQLKDVWFRYEKDAPDVLKGINLTVKKGEIFSILGGNGCGKTTALSLIAGSNLPYRGQVLINGEKLKNIKNLYTDVIGLLPQNPKLLFTKNTVRKEFSGKEEMLEKYAELCNITQCLDSHPYDLSGGELQRAALCKVLMKDPDILLLDEPTKGFDAEFKCEFHKILCELKKRGKTAVLVSHDVEFCAEVSDCCSMIFDGEAVILETPRKFFCRNHFYTTAANKMARTVIENALTAEDIILAFGKNPQQTVQTEKKEYVHETIAKKSEAPKKEKAKTPVKTILAVLFALIAVPATVYMGMTLLNDESYYLVSLLIIAETMIPFFAAFEGRKPRARELVMIAVMCGIAVAGRVVFAPVAQVKPMLAIVITAGVALGCEAGFMVGAVSAFVSNIFFGQGPWTPWQMFAFAVAGFLAGLFFAKFKKSKTAITVYGFISSLVIYSGIVNFSSVFLMKMPLTTETLLSTYAVALPFDLTHAISTAVFLWLIAKPIIEKIERVKTKYGI